MEEYFEDGQFNKAVDVPEFIEEQETFEEPEIIENPIKVYIKTNSNNEVIEINSEIFIKDLTGWTYIDEGFGDKYRHAQSCYFDKDILGENGHNYKYENGKIIENKG